VIISSSSSYDSCYGVFVVSFCSLLISLKTYVQNFEADGLSTLNCSTHDLLLFNLKYMKLLENVQTFC
jgi:hypothetical protein